MKNPKWLVLGTGIALAAGAIANESGQSLNNERALRCWMDTAAAREVWELGRFAHKTGDATVKADVDVNGGGSGELAKLPAIPLKRWFNAKRTKLGGESTLHKKFNFDFDETLKELKNFDVRDRIEVRFLNGGSDLMTNAREFIRKEYEKRTGYIDVAAYQDTVRSEDQNISASSDDAADSIVCSEDGPSEE